MLLGKAKLSVGKIRLYHIASQILRVATDGSRLRPWLACQPTIGTSYWCCSQTLTLLFQFSFWVDDHAHRHTFAKHLLIVIIVSALSVVIVIIAICDMPRQEFSLCERVYIHNTYMKSRKSCTETWCKFQVKFLGHVCLIPVQLGDRLKDSLTSNNNHNQ